MDLLSILRFKRFWRIFSPRRRLVLWNINFSFFVLYHIGGGGNAIDIDVVTGEYKVLRDGIIYRHNLLDLDLVFWQIPKMSQVGNGWQADQPVIILMDVGIPLTLL